MTISRPDPVTFFKQSLKSDAYYADELINIYLLRPVASVIVWLLYPTSVTPNQVTVIAILIGFAAAWTYTVGTPHAIAIAGFLVMMKDVFDDADGQLARAKQLYSRRGRFLDSIGDFVVDVAVFTAITSVVYQQCPSVPMIVSGILSLLGITLRVSYHVFYQASFLHLEDRYKLNRIVEEITEEDRKGDPVALRLQQLFVIIYNWQDRLMYRIDRWCMGKKFNDELLPTWYSDRFGLRISGLLGFGTELTLLAVCSWLDALPTYLYLNVFLMNGIWLASVLYRRLVLAGNLR
ncbi:MAG: CDP-alcohol phosphatidyltransferase family protein [Ignavibacteria bacterium]|nr:CDP-alcohol phosphatidyltransferase family protein [Ignavibacteria bacterium]